MTSYETERALVHFAEQIIKTFGKEIGIQDLIQGQKEQGMKYRGLYTFDTDNHKYVPIVSADGIIDLLDTDDYVPAEPLIKDPKIRKAVRAWAEINDLYSVNYKEDSNGAGFDCIKSTDELVRISFASLILPLEKNRVYTVTELCGEDEQ